MTEPARHHGTAEHRADRVPKSGRWRPRYVAAVAVVVALIGAGGIYATTQAGLPAGSSAGAGPSGTAVASPLTAPSPTASPSSPAPPSGDLAASDLPGTASGAPQAGAVTTTTTAAEASTKPADVPPAAVAVPAIGPELDAQINAIIKANSKYALGVTLIDLSDGVVHGYGDQSKFVAASTAKILAASAYYHLVETGRASLNARLGASTAGAQIRQMVQQSNNDSWALILGAVGQRGITDYAASIGITYDRTKNLLTPAEMARTLQLLYTGQLLNGTNTAQLLSYMQNTNYETLIPPAVPPGVGVFHKYGLLFGNLHDASILVKDGRAFVFVVYTLGKNYSDMGPRTGIIQQLTKTVTAALF